MSFYHANPDKTLKILQNNDSKKATQQGDILVRIIKENKFTFSKNLSEIFNLYIAITFPNGLKKVDIKPDCKKDDPSDKTKYRTIRITPVIPVLKLLNAAYIIEFMNKLILYHQNFNGAPEKVSVHSIH